MILDQTDNRLEGEIVRVDLIKEKLRINTRHVVATKSHAISTSVGLLLEMTFQ